ncbi:class II aldolase [Pelagibius litoralis]|uniref:Class II aldolase n=1 Tax=Pelagibius litoralis TaxID=374515 RepID=A0A967CB28_9PROT|nr:class II aldolase/adducin family protein [Pelagibius litoralis]NIA68068.1 class II aldolase [Pelagibius litoralis]
MSDFDRLRNSAAFAALLAASARLGRNPLQVQGPGGNASLKGGGAMLVKASGTWLSDAETKDIMVPVDSARFCAALRAGDPTAEDNAAFVPAEENPLGLRPSIETSVHAIFDWPVVIHTHCVATIATALRQDAADVVAARLGDLGAAFVPYAKPGLDLARAIDAATTPETRVLVLGNHGLVVGADTAEEAEALALAVAGRLTPAPPAVEGPMPDLGQFLAGTGWQAVDHRATTAIAHDPDLLSRLRETSFYPDHVIFLGPGILVGEEEETAAEAIDRAGKGAARKMIVFPGRGAAIPAEASPAMQALACCLGDVAARLDPSAKLNRLTPEQEAELLNWDAEKYRQAMDAGDSGGPNPR